MAKDAGVEVKHPVFGPVQTCAEPERRSPCGRQLPPSPIPTSPFLQHQQRTPLSMDHGDHGGHGGHDMPMGPMCSMNMLWNTQIIDTCIVFPSWHISSHTQFVLSCIAVAALGVLYEYLRAVQTAVDVRVARALAGSKGKTRARSGSRTPDGEPEEAGLLSGRRARRANEYVYHPAVNDGFSSSTPSERQSRLHPARCVLSSTVSSSSSPSSSC